MAIIRQKTGLTFDDVLLQPSLSDVLPSEVDVTTSLTQSIKLNIPIVASANSIYGIFTDLAIRVGNSG